MENTEDTKPDSLDALTSADAVALFNVLAASQFKGTEVEIVVELKRKLKLLAESSP